MKKFKAWPADLRLKIEVMCGSGESEVEKAGGTTFVEVLADFVGWGRGSSSSSRSEEGTTS